MQASEVQLSHWLRRYARAFWLAALLVAIVLVYAFFASAGHRGAWPSYMAYYDLQAEGFRAGHLYLAVDPPEELLAQLDPHDLRFSRWWMWDVSLYGGHYYLYWGPLPAVLQALAKSALGIHEMIGDQYLVFAFFSLSAVFGGLLIEHVARRLFPRVPASLIALSILAFGFVNPVPHLVATAGVYQAAIAGGQAFLLAGLLCALYAVSNSAGEVRQRLQLALAGLGWGLGLACRISLAPAVALCALATLLATAWPQRAAGQRRFWSARRAILRQFLALGAPLVGSLVLLLYYNLLRFDRWLEFGTHLQLTTMKFELSARYWLANSYSYVLRPFDLSCQFPYLHQVWNMGDRALPSWLHAPDGYLITEPVVGWLLAVPCTWLLPGAIWIAVQKARALRHEPAHPDAAGWRVQLWCIGCFGVLGSVSGLAVMGLYMATMRYLADVAFGLVLLGILGMFAVYSAAHSADTSRGLVLRRGALGLFTLLCGATVLIGLLLGYQGYNQHFQRFNPRLDETLTRALSLCANG